MVCVGSVPTWTVKSWLHRGTARLRRGECLHAVRHTGSSQGSPGSSPTRTWVRACTRARTPAKVRPHDGPGFVHALVHEPRPRFVAVTNPGSCTYLPMADVHTSHIFMLHLTFSIHVHPFACYNNIYPFTCYNYLPSQQMS